ncbi:hypothetical protein OHC33_004450 [Knufia fluminis]|uniref:K Homology domain-containing protein n=1 Tax=Knufia fluminis TaxID=191047 RepID=A0AAN8I8K4_9EURO|nr:hypothetical protein OHC33_004450 [Knufia fluminis]
MSEEAPRKRSRFDQTEPEPRKNSRFDRRSRSPAARNSESRRSRSPLAKRSPSTDSKPKTPVDAAAAAAAAAARINAQIEARKGIQHVDVPPIKASSSPAPVPKSATPSGGNSVSKVDGDIYIADGDYIKDIEVNDLRNRYTLTKGSTQKMIKDETGSDVTTRGSYYPDKTLATAANPPLYLHVTSTSKEGLEKAIEKINELMQQELPNLVDERRFRKREPDVERDELGRRKWPEAKIPIDMENMPGFNLRAKIVGQGGAYVKHIQNETRCRVQIKGRNSGFLEHGTGAESEEPMYLHVASPDAEQVERAKQLCESLVDSVRQDYGNFKANPPVQRLDSYLDGYGQDANAGRGYSSGYRERRRDDSYSNNYSGYGQNNSHYGSATPSTPAPGTSETPSAAQTYQDQWAAYYAQNPGAQDSTADPYAPYGGYQAYMNMYYASYYQQQGQDPNAQPQQDQSAPPPPADASAAPPPPASYGGYPGYDPSQPNGYNAVPPPPGI